MSMIRLLAAAALVAALHIGGAQAGVIYTYQGENYNAAFIGDDALPAGTYTTSMRLTGHFEVANALGPNLAYEDVSSSLLDYSFNDGRNTLTPATSNISYFTVSTDSTGSIKGWAFLIGADSGNNLGDQSVYMASLYVSSIITFGAELVGVSECVKVKRKWCKKHGFDWAKAKMPGDWTKVSPVPLPAAFPLLAAAFALIGGFGWWRRRRSLAVA